MNTFNYDTAVTSPVHTRVTVACNGCRKAHRDCVGFPCVRCVSEKIECVKEEYKPKSTSFKKGYNTGESNYNALHSSTKVYAIRERFMKGSKYGELKKWTDEYSVSYATLQAILNRLNYRDEPEAKPDGWDDFLKSKKGSA